MSEGRNGHAPPEGGRRLGVLAVVFTTLFAYSAVLLIGRAQDARRERVLGSLDPIFHSVRADGGKLIVWLMGHGSVVGWVATAVAAVLACAGLVLGGRRAVSLPLAAVGVCAIVWAQVLLFADHMTLGVALYLGGVACMAALGTLHPIRCLSGFPSFPEVIGPPRRGARKGDPAGAAARLPAAGRGWRPSWALECVLVVVLTVAALLSRVYALNELPSFLDLEVVDWWTRSRTGHGLVNYLRFGFMQNNGGTVQMFPQWVIFHLFGTSIFTLRMASVLWGIAAVPLMYGLVRRVAGVGPAVVSTLLFIGAPEQLYWARNENTHFAPLAVLALVTAHLGLCMVSKFSFRSVLAASLWMPFCRFFYSSGMVMFLYPMLLAAHAVVCVRGAWRKVWYVVPLLAGGLAVWILSLSFVYAAVHQGEWKFINPANVYGGLAWTKHGRFKDASFPDLVRLQSVSIAHNLSTALSDMTHHAHGFSHWYLRAQPPQHPTTVNAGLFVLVALGFGYLLGQIWDRRAFALLAWLGIAVLPAVLSNDPASRRMATVFPAMHVVAGVVVGVLVRLLRQRAGRVLGCVGCAVASVVVAVVFLTSMATHFQLRQRPVLYGDYVRFARPVIEGSDTIFHGFQRAFIRVMEFGNLDRFLQSPACVKHVAPGDWLRVALQPQCDFRDNVYRLTMAPERVKDLRAAYRPQKIAFLLEDNLAGQESIALLTDLFPRAEVRRYTSPLNNRKLFSLAVSRGQIESLLSPSVSGRVTPKEILKGVRLAPVAGGGTGARPAADVVVRGGLLLDEEGWYRVRTEPPCADAVLRFDGRAQHAAPEPLAAGVHSFSLILPRLAACKLPLEIQVATGGGTERLARRRWAIVGPSVAALSRARAAQVLLYEGYGEPRVITRFRGRPVDFGLDAAGKFNVIVRDGRRWVLERHDAAGKLLAKRDLKVPFGSEATSMAVAADATTAVLVGATVNLYSPDLRLIRSGRFPGLAFESELAAWGGHFLANIANRHSIVVFKRTGKVELELRTFDGGPGKFYRPRSLAVDAGGDMVVTQEDGRALLFRLAGDSFAPQFVRSFRTRADSHGGAFDARERIFLPGLGGLHVYDRRGLRMMAADPARDLAKQPFRGAVRALVGVDGALYVLDVGLKGVWKLVRK